MVHLVKIIVDPSKIEEYKKILKEEIEISLNVESDVHVLYAISDNARPNEFTILEIYKDQQAYDKHFNSVQLQKYFADTTEIVKNIEVIEVTPLIEGLWMK